MASRTLDQISSADCSAQPSAGYARQAGGARTSRQGSVEQHGLGVRRALVDCENAGHFTSGSCGPAPHPRREARLAEGEVRRAGGTSPSNPSAGRTGWLAASTRQRRGETASHMRLPRRHAARRSVGDRVFVERGERMHVEHRALMPSAASASAAPAARCTVVPLAITVTSPPSCTRRALPGRNAAGTRSGTGIRESRI